MGPDQAYVAVPGVVVLPCNVKEPPKHAGPLLLAVALGTGLTTKVVVAGVEEQPPTVIVTEYTPALAAVALLKNGLWSVEVKPPGPDH